MAMRMRMIIRREQALALRDGRELSLGGTPHPSSAVIRANSGPALPVCQPSVKIRDAGGDVVAHQSHPFDAVDSAFGWLVGVAVLKPGSGDLLDTGFASERHDYVYAANELGVNGLGSFCADVDANFGVTRQTVC